MPKSYGIVIGDRPFLYPDKTPGLQLGSALSEPSRPSQVATFAIESLHHGAGATLADSDPMKYRDTNGQAVGCDARQPGFVMPGGYLRQVGQIPIQNTSTHHPLPDRYAASFVMNTTGIWGFRADGTEIFTNIGDVVFCAGQEAINVNIQNDQVITTAGTLASDLTNPYMVLNADSIFTGGNFFWNGKFWVGGENLTVGGSNVLLEVWQSGVDLRLDNAEFFFNWAVSTRNGVFWINNAANHNPPFMYWSDETGTDFTAIDPDPDTGFVYGPFFLEIPKAFITGMGVAGVYPVFANAGGSIWGFDPTEVFIPLTPDLSNYTGDNLFGGPMVYAGNTLLMPASDGVRQFSSRELTIRDITPAIHQQAQPNFTPRTVSRRVEYVCNSPTGAVVFTRFGGEDPSILNYELYDEGSYYHIAYQGLPVNRVWGAVLARGVDGDGNTTSNLRLYVLAADPARENWNVYRMDVPTQGWQPGPENMAPLSGLRTAAYGAPPNGVTCEAIQVRGYAQADSDNYISLGLEIDGREAIHLGELNTTGPFAIPIPIQAAPGRRMAVTMEMTVGNNSGIVPYLTLPLNIDYLYAPQAPDGADHLTITVIAPSDYVDLNSGGQFRNGQSDMDWLVGLQGTIVDITLADRVDQPHWHVFVEEVKAQQVGKDEGYTSTTYQVVLTCRRVD